jgi:hypothetical protein
MVQSLMSNSETKAEVFKKPDIPGPLGQPPVPDLTEPEIERANGEAREKRFIVVRVR